MTLNNRMTFNEFFEEFMILEGNNKYANATKINYNNFFNIYMKDTIGRMNLSSIKYVDLQKFFNEQSKKHGYPTLRGMRKVFSVVFQYALRVGYVKENPVPLVQLPKVTEEKIKVETISDEDLNTVIKELQKVKTTNPYRKDKNPHFTFMSYAMALVIGRYTGLRISEALALHKEDFDLENKTMNICRKIEYLELNTKEMYVVNQMKSKSSRSKVAISDKLIQYLKP